MQQGLPTHLPVCHATPTWGHDYIQSKWTKKTSNQSTDPGPATWLRMHRIVQATAQQRGAMEGGAAGRTYIYHSRRFQWLQAQ